MSHRMSKVSIYAIRPDYAASICSRACGMRSKIVSPGTSTFVSPRRPSRQYSIPSGHHHTIWRSLHKLASKKKNPLSPTPKASRGAIPKAQRPAGSTERRQFYEAPHIPNNAVISSENWLGQTVMDQLAMHQEYLFERAAGKRAKLGPSDSLQQLHNMVAFIDD